MIEMVIQSFGAMLSPEAKENLEKAIKGLAEVPARLDRLEAKLDEILVSHRTKTPMLNEVSEGKLLIKKED